MKCRCSITFTSLIAKLHLNSRHVPLYGADITTAKNALTYLLMKTTTLERLARVIIQKILLTNKQKTRVEVLSHVTPQEASFFFPQKQEQKNHPAPCWKPTT